MHEFFLNFIKSPLFAILTGLTGILCGNWLNIGRERRNDFNVAAKVFRDTFNNEFICLQNKEFPSRFIDESKHFVKEQSAYFEFRHYVSWIKKRGFDSAWKKYYKYKKKSNSVFGNTERSKRILKSLELLEILIFYANPK